MRSKSGAALGGKLGITVIRANGTVEDIPPARPVSPFVLLLRVARKGIRIWRSRRAK